MYRWPAAGLAGLLMPAAAALAQEAPAASAATPAPATATTAAAPGATPTTPTTPTTASNTQRVEVTAQPASDTELRRRDPVAKSIYGREELDKHGDTNVVDVLKRLPGVNLQGGSPRLRGLGAGYTLILVNGDPAPPGFSLDNLSPSQVERIEVTKGPTAENPAVAGTINIVLREAPRQRQRELRLNIGYQVARPVGSASGTWGDRAGDFSYVLPVSVYQWRGGANSASSRYVHKPNSLTQERSTQGRDDSWGGGFNIGPRLSWKLGADDSLNLQLYLQRNDFNNQGVYDTTVLQGPPPVSVHDSFRSGGHWAVGRGNLQWLHRGSDGQRLELKASAQASEGRFFNHSIGLDGQGLQSLVRDTQSSTDERGGTLGGKYSRPVGEDHTLVLGWDVEQRSRHEQRSTLENGQEQLKGIEGQPFESQVQRAAVYAQDDWEINRLWAAAIGLRVEQVNTRSDGLDASLRNQASMLAPVLHLKHKLNASDNPAGRDLLRISLHRSYRLPELSQLVGRYSTNGIDPPGTPNTVLTPDRMGNPGLKPELSTGFDIALEKYLPAGGVASIGVFHRRISGLIRTSVDEIDVPDSAVKRWVSRPTNLDSARSTGLEFELKGRADELIKALWPQPPGWPGRPNPPSGLSLRGSLSVYRSSVQGLPRPNDRLEGQQPWSGSFGFDWALGPQAALGGLSLSTGASLGLTPAYTTQQTVPQRSWQAGSRSLDAYALLTIDKQTQLRLSAGNLLARPTRGATWVGEGTDTEARSSNWRRTVRNFNLNLSLKL